MKKLIPLTSMEIISYFGIAMGIFAILDKLTLGTSLATIISVALFFIIGIVVSISRVWETRENEFLVSKDIAGNESKKDIINAESSILFTHFTEEKPSDVYTELLLDKLRNNVTITRILPKNIDLTNPRNKWLMKFNEFKGNGYSEYFLDANILPFDIAVYDERTVKFLLPINKDSSQFNQSVSLNNEKVARMVIASIERLNIPKGSN